MSRDARKPVFLLLAAFAILLVGLQLSMQQLQSQEAEADEEEKARVAARQASDLADAAYEMEREEKSTVKADGVQFKRKIAKRIRTSVVGDAVASKGVCYLQWEEADQGTLTTYWAKEHIHQALAIFKPKGTVPPYKFKGNSARKELQRNASSDGGPHVKRYYHGWCEYIKMCRQFEGSILFPEELPVALWLDTESDGVRMLEPNKFHDLSKSAVPGEFAIAVLHPEKDTFEGIKEMRLQVGGR